MASGVNVKMGVSGIAQFKQSISDAKQSIKTLDAQLSLTEKQFKATGDSESYMAEKTALLQAKLEAQKSVVQGAESALQQMAARGVDRSSQAYQNMYRQMIQAKSGMLDTENAINGISTASEKAGENVNEMNDDLKNVGKGVAWENITNGLGKVIDKLESGAKAAINFGKKIAQSAMDSTGWADEILTTATKYGTDADTIQRMRNVAEIVDTDVDTILNAKSRLAKNKDSLADLIGLNASGMSLDEAFWKAGEAIQAMTDEFEKEEAAQKVFGRGWHDLVPLFTEGQEKYNNLMAEQNVLTNEQVERLGKADDAFKKVQQQVELMKNQFWADNADKITELLQWIVDNKDGVVTAVTAIGTAFGALKLGEMALNVAKLVDGFKSLGVIKGGKAAASAAGSGGTLAKAGGFVKTALTSGAAVPAAVAAAAIAPALFANAADDQRVEAKRQSRLASASMMGPGVDSEFLTRASNALGLKWHGGNESEVLSILMGMKDRSDLQKAQLQAQLNGSSTSQGNITWNELQRLWNGTEEFDSARLNATLESVTDSYTKMAEQTSELTGATDESSKASQEMSAAAKSMMDIPGLVGDAVRSGMSGITFVLDGSAITNYVDRQLGNKVNMARR